MVVLSPITVFSAPASTSHISRDKISYSVFPRVSLKCLQRFPGRLGNGSGDVVSSGRALGKEVPVLSSSVFARVEYFADTEPQSIAAESGSDLRDWFTCCSELLSDSSSRHALARTDRSVFICNCSSHESQETSDKEDSIEDTDEPSGGVAIAVKILQFYKREISPLLPGSCRFVPTCSEYGMQAFKKYGVVKGAILTAWRLSRCNPLGGSGFDPPRWFDEPKPPSY